MMKSPHRFFIAGCQRSGTTLMRLVLESHPRVSCLDETRSYHALRGEPVEVPNGTDRLGFKVPRWTERFGEAGGDLPDPPFYGGEPVLFLLRDVRDTVASMMALDLGGESWLESWGRPLLEQKTASFPGFAAKYGREIEVLRASNDRAAGVGALYWLDKSSSFFRYVEDGLPVVGVRYEALVNDPRPHLSRAISALEIGWDERVLNHPSLPHGEILDRGLTVGGSDPRRAIDSASVGRWRQLLGAEDLKVIDAIAGPLNERIAGIK